MSPTRKTVGSNPAGCAIEKPCKSSVLRGFRFGRWANCDICVNLCHGLLAFMGFCLDSLGFALGHKKIIHFPPKNRKNRLHTVRKRMKGKPYQFMEVADMTTIKILIPGTIDPESMLFMLFHPDQIPDDVYIDMHDGRLMPAQRFFRECLESLKNDE